MPLSVMIWTSGFKVDESTLMVGAVVFVAVVGMLGVAGLACWMVVANTVEGVFCLGGATGATAAKDWLISWLT